MIRLFTIVMLVFSLTGMALAQEEPDPAKVIELEGETTLGEITLRHPEAWTAQFDQSGNILLANADLSTLGAGATPDDLILVQVIVASTNLLPLAASNTSISAADIINSLNVPSNEDFPIEDIEIEDREPAARVRQPAEGQEVIIYTILLDDETFALVLLAVAPGLGGDAEPVVEAILPTIAVGFEAPFAEGTATRYDDFAQSTTDEGFPRLGDPDAPVTIIEISSFDCPHCRTFHDNVLPSILERIAAGEVQFIYVPVFGTGGIPAGQSAAIAALCAGEQGAFWSYHDGIFDWQAYQTTAFAAGRLAAGAAGLDLDMEAWETCLTSAGPQETLLIASEFAFSRPDFRGTPTIYVNDELTNATVDAISARIDSLLSELGD